MGGEAVSRGELGLRGGLADSTVYCNVVKERMRWPDALSAAPSADATAIAGLPARARLRTSARASISVFGSNRSFHRVSVKHLHRYLSEFEFRFNIRKDEDRFSRHYGAWLESDFRGYSSNSFWQVQEL